MLLKNAGGVLPLNGAALTSINIIGPHADAEMISGCGSAQVDAPGRPNAGWQAHVWFPTSPMKAVKAHAPGADVQTDSGADLASAAALAKKSDVAIVFVYQWMSEGMDLALTANAGRGKPRPYRVAGPGEARPYEFDEHHRLRRSL